MNTSRLLLSFAVAVAFPAAGCRRDPVVPAPLQVRTTPARALPAAPREAGPAFLGFIRGDTETNLSFNVSGQLVRLGPPGAADDWREGTFVAAGTELAQLDTANFRSAVAAARARAELARAAFERNSELYAAANLSQNEFESSRTQKETAEADLAQAEQALRDTVLRAPYDGVILSRAAKTGEFAGAGKAVLRLGDFRRVSLEVGVPDTLLGEVAVGQAAVVRVSAFESQAFTGTISEVGTAASDGNRLFRVVLKLDNADGRLKGGMTASVRLGAARALPPGGVLVPLSALVASRGAGGGPAVFVAGPDGRAHERAVRTADLVDSSIVVVDGLAEGELVVTQGAGQLFEGAAIASGPAL